MSNKQSQPELETEESVSRARIIRRDEHHLQSERHVISWRMEHPDKPTLVCLAGIHGNELMGVEALKRVSEKLTGRELEGNFVALAGNVRALELGLRFIDQDLNRIWTSDRIFELRRREFTSCEEAEQLELLGIVERIFKYPSKELYFVDLHTTSADGGPFSIFGDTIRNRRFASHLPATMILGLEEQIEGALLDYLGQMGAVTVAFEAGQHETPDSADLHESALWIALVESGLLEPDACTEISASRRILKRATAGLPSVVEVVFRFPVAPGDDFHMQPGFRNFMKVRKGQHLATNFEGPIRSPRRGRILLPLYQPLGNDGFFIARDISPFWLALSRWLRQLNLDRFLPLLPGLERNLENPRTLEIRSRLGGWLAVHLFHLFGYRRRKLPSGRYGFVRREFDLKGPSSRPRRAGVSGSFLGDRMAE
jgi:succinylglutamate desuccinylase